MSLLTLLHENEAFLVVDKPAGLVCHGAKQGPAASLIGRVRVHVGHDDGRLVNRLDRETSGVVVVAKSKDVARELGRLFAAGVVTKEYLGIVHGHLTGAIEIDAPLGKDELSAVAIKDCVRADGAAAVTFVTPIERLSRGDDRFTVVRVQPRTGRKHQIRIHLAHAGFPLVGDKIYGADPGRYLRFVVGALTASDRAALMCENHALHAHRMAFTWRGQAWAFHAPVPRSFAVVAGGPMNALWA